jgi:hypothetical protein
LTAPGDGARRVPRSKGVPCSSGSASSPPLPSQSCSSRWLRSRRPSRSRGQGFAVGRYKIVVDKLGFFDAYAQAAPKKIDFSSKITARPRNILWIGPPPICGGTADYHGKIVRGKLVITTDLEDKDCLVRKAIFVGTWTR